MLNCYNNSIMYANTKVNRAEDHTAVLAKTVAKGDKMMKLPHSHNDSEQIKELHRQLEHSERFEIASELFRNLGDLTRIKIFWLLCHCEECVINLSAMTGMSSPAVSHHLRPLKSSGLIVSRREGKEVYYRAADTELVKSLHEMLEQLMEISCTNSVTPRAEIPTDSRAETVRAVHAYLLSHLDERLTIDELSRRFLINPTTLKAAFKEVYGGSLAAHIKEHRMERAAELLKSTNDSIAEIAHAVGYDSQSRFTTAFKAYYSVLPRAFRKG